MTVPLDKAVQQTQQVAPVFRHLLMPVAVAAYTLAGWRVAADLDLAGEFFVSGGLFSHWQVWLGLAVGTHFTASYLDRINGSGSRKIVVQ
jgi:hypothetical protein